MSKQRKDNIRHFQYTDSMTIRHLLFDLDNTLYTSESAISAGISNRMIAFISRYLNVSQDEARKLRMKGIPHYGTTLEWLMTEQGLKDADEFYRFVHPVETERKELIPDPGLRSLLESLGMPMTILTNAPRIHALTVLDFFDITDLFESIHDIETNGYKGKPHASAYMNALSSGGHTLEDTLFFDDHPKYTKGYSDIGGKAVLVKGTSVHGNLDGWDTTAPDAFAVIRSVYDIPELLERCSRM